MAHTPESSAGGRTFVHPNIRSVSMGIVSITVNPDNQVTGFQMVCGNQGDAVYRMMNDIPLHLDAQEGFRRGQVKYAKDGDRLRRTELEGHTVVTATVEPPVDMNNFVYQANRLDHSKGGALGRYGSLPVGQSFTEHLATELDMRFTRPERRAAL